MKIIKSFLVFALTGAGTFFLVYGACKFLDESQDTLALVLGVLIGIAFTTIDLVQTEE